MIIPHIITLAFFTFLANIPDSQQLKGFSVEHMNCTHNQALCKDLICHSNSTAEDPMVFHLSFGCVLLKAVPKLKVVVTTYTKSGKTFNSKAAVTTQLDLCKLSSVTTNSVFMTFLPDIANQLSNVFQPCPYTGEFMVKDFVFDGSIMPLLPGTPETKTKMIFMRGKYQPILTVFLYGKLQFK